MGEGLAVRDGGVPAGPQEVGDVEAAVNVPGLFLSSARQTGAPEMHPHQGTDHSRSTSRYKPSAPQMRKWNKPQTGRRQAQGGVTCLPPPDSPQVLTQWVKQWLSRSGGNWFSRHRGPLLGSVWKRNVSQDLLSGQCLRDSWSVEWNVPTLA